MTAGWSRLGHRGTDRVLGCGHLLWFREVAGTPASSAGQVILQIIEVRFGPPPPELESAVTALAGRADAERVLDRILTARSLTELLADG
jgi:hypothetical protein